MATLDDSILATLEELEADEALWYEDALEVDPDEYDVTQHPLRSRVIVGPGGGLRLRPEPLPIVTTTATIAAPLPAVKGSAIVDLEEMLALASLGYRVFPLKPGTRAFSSLS